MINGVSTLRRAPGLASRKFAGNNRIMIEMIFDRDRKY